MKYLKLFENEFYLKKEIFKYIEDVFKYISKYTTLEIREIKYENNVFSFSVVVEEYEYDGYDVIEFRVNPIQLKSRYFEDLANDLYESFKEEFHEVVAEEIIDENTRWGYEYDCFIKEEINRAGKSGLMNYEKL